MTASEHISPESTGERSHPPEDELFDVLANRRRRYVIEHLTNHEEGHDIGTLSTRIAARENEIPVEAVTSSERKRVYTALQQSHLPKLDAAGLIEFDKQRGTAEPLSTLEMAEQYLTEKQTDKPWSGYYLGLTAVSAVVVLSVWGDLWPFVLLSPLVWTVGIVAVFGATAALHRYETTAETSVW